MRIKAVLMVSVLFVGAACSRHQDSPPATIAELEKVTAAKDAHQIATFIFDNYGCSNCQGDYAEDQVVAFHDCAEYKPERLASFPVFTSVSCDLCETFVLGFRCERPRRCA